MSRISSLTETIGFMSPQSGCDFAAASVAGAGVLGEGHADRATTTDPTMTRLMACPLSRNSEPDDRSEVELRRELDEARSGRGDDVAERGADDVAVDGARAVELRMVEDVERLETNLEVPGASELHVLDDGEIEILNPR